MDLDIVKKIQKKCGYCGIIFYRCKGNKGKYCSHRCSGKATGFQIGEKSWNAGTSGIFSRSSRPLEVRNKISKTLTGRKRPEISGKNHFKWSGGYSRGYILDNDWRKRVFERDGFMCQNCGDTGYLEAHHIKSWKDYPELRSNLNNGITLCLNCHYAVHGKVMRKR